MCEWQPRPFAPHRPGGIGQEGAVQVRPGAVCATPARARAHQRDLRRGGGALSTMPNHPQHVSSSACRARGCQAMCAKLLISCICPGQRAATRDGCPLAAGPSVRSPRTCLRRGAGPEPQPGGAADASRRAGGAAAGGAVRRRVCAAGGARGRVCAADGAGGRVWGGWTGCWMGPWVECWVAGCMLGMGTGWGRQGGTHQRSTRVHADQGIQGHRTASRHMPATHTHGVKPPCPACSAAGNGAQAVARAGAPDGGRDARAAHTHRGAHGVSGGGGGGARYACGSGEGTG